MQTDRIPDFVDKNQQGMQAWFSEMARRGLLFHPEDSASEMIDLESGEPMFRGDECTKLDAIIAEMFAKFGAGVCDAAYPIFMSTAGFPAQHTLM